MLSRWGRSGGRRVFMNRLISSANCRQPHQVASGELAHAPVGGSGAFQRQLRVVIHVGPLKPLGRAEFNALGYPSGQTGFAEPVELSRGLLNHAGTCPQRERVQGPRRGASVWTHLTYQGATRGRRGNLALDDSSWVSLG